MIRDFITIIFLLFKLQALYYLIFMSLFILLIIIALLSFLFISDLLYYIKDTLVNAKTCHNDSLDSGESLKLSLAYKITSLKTTLSIIFLCFSLAVISLLVLRYSRLGQEVHIYILFSKTFSMPVSTKILLMFTLLVYLLIFKGFFSLMKIILYMELKKLHIYLCSTNLYGTRYCYDWFLNKVITFIPFRYGLELISNSDKYSRMFLSYKDIKKDYKIPWILVPFFHLTKFSKYKEHIISKSIQKLAKFLGNNLWSILEIIPISIVFISFILEVFQGVIKYTYYIIFFMFILKLLLDLSLFEYNTSYFTTEYICVCYYHKSKLYLNNNYGRKIKAIYIVYTSFEENEKCNLFLLTGLNWPHCLAILNNEPWPLHNHFFNKKKKQIRHIFEKVIKILRIDKIMEKLYPS